MYFSTSLTLNTDWTVTTSTQPNGFKWVSKPVLDFGMVKGYDYIFEMDADFSHNPKDLVRLYEACKHADMAVGSRYSQGVNVVNWPMGRVLLSYFASQYVRFVLRIPVFDTTAGFPYPCGRLFIPFKSNISSFSFSI